MKKPFQVGERIAYYRYDERSIGTIDEVDNYDSTVRVSGDSDWYHFKQCRRLVKKKRREIWVSTKGYWSDCAQDGWVKFVEAKK